MHKLEKIWRIAFGRGLLIPTRCVRRYTHLDVGRNKPVRALSAGLALPTWM